MERIMNLFSTMLIASGQLERRFSRIDNRCWIMSVEYLQDDETINNFLVRRKLVNYVYSILYELHRDFFPVELRRVRGSLKAFLATVHNFLHLSNEFIFDSTKLQNIIKQRRKRYNTIERSEETPENSIFKAIYKFPNPIEACKFLENNNLVNEIKEKFGMYFQMFVRKQFVEKQKQFKKNPNYYVSPDIVEENILATLNSIMQNLMLDGTFDEQFNCLMNKFTEFQIPRLRQVTINSNGIFFIDIGLNREYAFYIGTAEIYKDQILKNVVYYFLKFNILFRRMKIQKPFTHLYQILCLAMNQKALAKKNREAIGITVENFWREMNGDIILPEDENNDVIMVDDNDDLSPEELQILETMERNLEI